MSKKVVFFENLDGLRFFAFLAVFLKHSFYTESELIRENEIFHFVSNLWRYGGLGVNFFFVLSGFLITYLLLQEKEINKNVNIKSFYVRRTLRIWPLYYATVCFGFIVFPILKNYFGYLPNESANPINYIFFMANFDSIWHGLPDSSILSVLWSVAVEEQFYLIWPWIFYFLRNKQYPYIFIGIILTSLFFRYYHINSDPHILKFHTLSVISDMALGGLCAYLSLFSIKFILFFKRLKKSTIIGIYIVGFSLITFNKDIFQHPLLQACQVIILSFFFAFIILEQNYSDHSFYKLKNFKTISWLGRLTYGLYCLHFIGILTATTLSKLIGTNQYVYGVMIFETLLALAITIFISWLSFNYFEKFFLKLKKKFSYISKGDQLV